MPKSTTYNSKILLFGEHIVNKGANALAMPLDKFSCQLVSDKDAANLADVSHEILSKMVTYIQESDFLKEHIDIAAFAADVDTGLYVNMNIPVGYGLGSSGALVACVYDLYKRKDLKSIDELKRILGGIESVFHGKSSGLDPLVSYLNNSVLVEPTASSVIATSESYKAHFHLFLADTGKARQTGPLVELFLDKIKSNASFAKVVSDQIVPLNNELIHHFLQEEWSEIRVKFKRLSQLQFDHFKFLILPEHLDIWQHGLDSDTYYLKICGAGGGGFMLGYSDASKRSIAIKSINL